MTQHVEVTDEHMARAYAEMRLVDWPSLAILRDHHRHFTLVRARAVALASGLAKAATPAALPPPAPPALPQNLRRSDPSRAPQTPSLFSPRMAAAGEYTHPNDE